MSHVQKGCSAHHNGKADQTELLRKHLPISISDRLWRGYLQPHTLFLSSRYSIIELLEPTELELFLLCAHSSNTFIYGRKRALSRCLVSFHCWKLAMARLHLFLTCAWHMLMIFFWWITRYFVADEQSLSMYDYTVGGRERLKSRGASMEDSAVTRGRQLRCVY